LGLFVLIITALADSWLVLAGCAVVIALCVILSQFIKSFAHWITTNLNLMITMLAGGLWHGASWNFIIWGGLNGAGLVFYKLWRKISPWERKDKWYTRAWAIFLTFTFITFTRVWFRAGSNTSWSGLSETHDITSEFLSATTMLQQIFRNMDWSVAPMVLWGYWNVVAVIIIGLVIHWLPSAFKENYRTRFARMPIWVIGLSCIATIFFVYQVMAADMHPFIYFQF
jgi:hypothetical protein